MPFAAVVPFDRAFVPARQPLPIRFAVRPGIYMAAAVVVDDDVAGAVGPPNTERKPFDFAGILPTVFRHDATPGRHPFQHGHIVAHGNAPAAGMAIGA